MCASRVWEVPGWNPGGFFVVLIMVRMIAYMLTWTTYGTWLQGDKRRYVKDGETARNQKIEVVRNKVVLR